MNKKIMKLLATVFVGVAVISVAPVKAQAALPCTYDIIYDANGNITNGKEMLAQATANKNAAKANYDALVKANASQLEIEKAAYAMNNAINVERWWVDQVNNANAYLKNITDREKFEDKFAANRAALNDLTALQKAKTDADGAKNIANGVLKQIEDVKKAIAGYQQQLAVSPSVQTQIDSLTKTLATLEADYASKLAVANEKEAAFNTALKTLGYASYDLAFENYQHNREINRGNPNWKP